MAADVRLVPRAAERDADVLASHRASDRLRDRGLADSGRSGEEEDPAPAPARTCAARLSARPARASGSLLRRGLGLRRLLRRLRELPDREELEDPVLHVLQPVVVLVEDPRGLLHVEVLFTPRVPRELRDRLEIGADDLRLHGLAADPGQARPLAVDLLARFLRKVERVELRAKLLQRLVVRALSLAELPLDRLHLLAQVHLALAASELFLHLLLDVLLRGKDVDLPLHVHEGAAEPVLDGQRLEERLPLRGRDVDVSGDEVREPPGLVDLREDLVDGLLGETHLLAELRGPLARFAVKGEERRVARVEGRHLLRFLDRRFEVPVPRDVAKRDAARLSLQEQANSAEAALNRPDRGDRADRVELLRGDFVAVLPLGDGKNSFIRAVHRGVDRLQRAGTSGVDRKPDAREED